MQVYIQFRGQKRDDIFIITLQVWCVIFKNEFLSCIGVSLWSNEQSLWFNHFDLEQSFFNGMSNCILNFYLFIIAGDISESSSKTIFYISLYIFFQVELIHPSPFKRQKPLRNNCNNVESGVKHPNPST